MFNGLKKKKEQPDKNDETVDLTLKFEDGGEEVVQLTREEMLYLTYEASQYGRKVEDHIQKILWDEIQKGEGEE